VVVWAIAQEGQIALAVVISRAAAAAIAMPSAEVPEDMTDQGPAPAVVAALQALDRAAGAGSAAAAAVLAAAAVVVDGAVSRRHERNNRSIE
jgi:hypothetical protein